MLFRSMVTRDLVRHAKPDPDLFLAAAAVLGVEPRYAMVVGDSVWDLLAARRAGALGVGLMSGGYGREELERAGAYRVYADPAEMLTRIDELGVRPDPELQRSGVTAHRSDIKLMGYAIRGAGARLGVVGGDFRWPP